MDVYTIPTSNFNGDAGVGCVDTNVVSNVNEQIAIIIYCTLLSSVTPHLIAVCALTLIYLHLHTFR